MGGTKLLPKDVHGVPREAPGVPKERPGRVCCCQWFAQKGQRDAKESKRLFLGTKKDPPAETNVANDVPKGCYGTTILMLISVGYHFGFPLEPAPELYGFTGLHALHVQICTHLGPIPPLPAIPLP